MEASVSRNCFLKWGKDKRGEVVSVRTLNWSTYKIVKGDWKKRPCQRKILWDERAARRKSRRISAPINTEFFVTLDLAKKAALSFNC
jgi:hypothetical protein